MEYTKQLKNKAVGRTCEICNTVITEDQAGNCELQYSKTANRELFIHTKCWNELYGKKVLS